MAAAIAVTGAACHAESPPANEQAAGDRHVLVLSDGVLSTDHDPPAQVNLRFRDRPQIHDPSAILQDGNLYRCFSTGMGVQTLCSADLTIWRTGPPLFDAPPKWVNDVVPNHRGHFWAPDVIQWRGRFLVYYSVSELGKRTSAIALASSPTLDPNAPDYAWSDHGIIVQTDESFDYNAIDPAVIVTPNGELWMAFGSFWSGIKLIQLDPASGLRQHPDSPMYSLAKKDPIEAPWICYRDGYFYLFVNWGYCCRGVRSTYNIRVGRSQLVTGPYFDREGVNLAHGGGSLVLDTVDDAVGPGHGSIFEHDGELMFSYHYYAGKNGGRPQLGINSLRWSADGWPEVDGEMAISGTIVQSD